VYYVANMLLESVLHTFNALVYSVLAYFMLNYAAYSQPASVAKHFGTFLLIMIVQTNVGSMILQFCALLAPNQDIAFALAAGG
jgi:hypothetical protein